MLLDSPFGIFMHNTFGSLDMAIFSFFGGIQNDIFTYIARFFSGFGDYVFFLLLGLFMVFLFFFKRARKISLLIILALVMYVVFTVFVSKYSLQRLRPYNMLQGYDQYFQWYLGAGQIMESEYCFPSGHTTTSMCVATVLFFVLKNDYRKKWAGVVFVYPLLMGCSRIYLMVHYPTDVICGFVLGFLEALIVFLIYYIYDSVRIKNPKFALRLEKIDLEPRFGGKLKGSNAVLASMLIVCALGLVSVVYTNLSQETLGHRCEHVDNRYICCNKAKNKVLDEKSGEYHYYCDLHEKDDSVKAK